MAVERSRKLGALAAAVSDGRHVDWDGELALARESGDTEFVRSLQLLASISDAHRDLLAEPAPSGGVDKTAAHGPDDGATVLDFGEEPLVRWGPLEILERTGGGAFGDVYRAWDTRLDREVALKLLREEPASGGRRASEFVEEGRLLARVRHANVATVHGAEVHEGRAGLWMEFIRGRTLRDLLREQGPLGAREAAVVGLDLCRALAAVHRAGLVHRDLKAQNVMREEGGRIVLMDFGAGKQLSAEGPQPDREISGTPLYMAPEVLEGRGATTASDTYSLGVLLYHLVTGDFPVRGQSLAELREAHASRRTHLLRDARPDLPESFVQAVERAIEREPAERFASAGVFERALAAALGAEGRGDGRPHEPGRGRGLKLAVGVGLGALALFATWAFVTREPAERHEPRSAEPRAADRLTAPQPTRPLAEARAPVEGARQSASPVPAEASTAAAPPDVEARMYRWGPAYQKALSDGDAVEPGDELYLEIESGESLYVYVLNQDQRGRAFVLFPLPGSELGNPLPPGVRHRLPGSVTDASTGKRQDLRWGVDTVGGQESFLLVAARERLPDIEQEFRALGHARMDGQVEVDASTVTRLRGVSRVVSREAPQPAGSREALTRISGSGSLEGVWVREIVLANPGS